MAQFNDSKWRRDQMITEGKGYFVWSGTYGKDDPRKMKDLIYVNDLDASIKMSNKHNSKHGNSRAMIDYEFKKKFPKAYKAYRQYTTTG